MKSRHFIYLALIALPLIGAQCVQVKTGGAGSDGGVFKSLNQGQEWKQKAAIPTVSGVPKSFASFDIIVLAQDPSDALAIYAGTKENGMLYSYDGGESWRQPKQLVSGKVNAVAIDPKDKCNVYVAVGSRLLKSTDCSRTFSEINNNVNEVTALAIDSANSANIYIGDAKGIVLKSQTGGQSWQMAKNFGGKIVDLIINPKNASMVYAAVLPKGVWKSNDGGVNWEDLNASFKKLSNSSSIRRLVMNQNTPEILLAASKYGLLRTKDGGQTWEPLTLVTKPSTVDLSALAVSPKDAKEIYYTTAATFYRSLDGGVSWATKKMPTSRAGTYLLVDRVDSKMVYMGVIKIEK